MKTIEDFQIIRRKRQKRIIIRKTVDNHLLVSAPINTPLREIKKLIKHHEDALLSLPVKPDFDVALNKPETLTIFDHVFPVYYHLGKPDVTISPNYMTVISHTNDVKTIRNQLKTALKKHLLKTVQALHKSMQETHPELKAYDVSFHTRFTLSRFGSCNRIKNRINLNLALVHYPSKYLKSVYLHEITHLFVPGHSREFYNKLASLDPDYRENKENLERHHRIYLRDNATAI